MGFSCRRHDILITPHQRNEVERSMGLLKLRVSNTLRSAQSQIKKSKKLNIYICKSIYYKTISNQRRNKKEQNNQDKLQLLALFASYIWIML